MEENILGYYRKAYIRTEFPVNVYSTHDFSKKATEILSSLLELTYPSTLNSQLQNEINEGINSIQVETYYEEIEKMLNRELDLEKDMHMKYVDSFALERLKNLSPSRVTRNRLSRIPGKIVRIPTGLVSLKEIEQNRRKEIFWNSYLLTRLCRNTRLRRQFVSVNSIVLPHFFSRKRYSLPTTCTNHHHLDIQGERKAESQHQKESKREIVKDGTIIVTVSFYHQIRGMKISEFDILETQTLSELANSFICHDSKQEEELLGFYPTGDCFEINGDLYLNGTDDIKSSFINTLSGFTIKSIPQTFDMKNTPISHLNIPINSHSTYIHSGDCEHRVTFTNIRLFNSKYDSPYKDSYPIQIYSHSRTLTFCEICGINQVTKVIFNSLNLPRNPSQLCDSCTFIFLYDKNTKQSIEKCIIRSINNK
ncbi:snRNA-activating protein of 50kDa MW C terminal family protein [Cryptosporidium meleagridis]|uniref:snRNA-activating protein of 50kDa MW C terminal family protein n=1 Tax=Cryptosporidium meleagridis TaxID=93969 RepID=A0A2P4Z290_9CRYT|nr:snRNA-activating protein of 50kDa MW C terminal family protein [Cryptosporidium meleagridis]